jgi:hypothetical protein
MGKIVAIHQPNYIPWIGYFHKIDKSDIFVFLDDGQYAKNQVANRNKIKTAKGWIYLTIPVLIKGHYGQSTQDVEIDNHINWRKKHWKSILFNYNKAQYFKKYSTFFKELYKREWKKLSELNEFIIRHIMEALSIKTELIRSSELNVQNTQTDRLIDIVKAVGGNTYLSGIHGKDYMDENKYKESNIKLTYQDFHHPTYNQLYGEFVPNMSIIDLLFNEGEGSIDIIRGA